MKKMGVDDYKWHCDFIQLAWDSGFSFGKYQYPNIDKYKICLVDIERIIRERDVASVENQIPTILQFTLDNDQANVLDPNFVKVFRISQLSVEYLMFCKKYLDNLVISMKKEISDLKHEKKELKSYVEELETHLSATTNNLISTFRCEKCPKVFSSQNYLTSHFKRRHDEENIKENLETAKLYSELTELREKVNLAEKTIKEKADEPESEKLRMEESSSSKFIDEIQKNFVTFREQVEHKIEHLQSEKQFFNEKYDKLFDVLLQYKNKEVEQKDKERIEENKYKEESSKNEGIAEHGTQTEDINKFSNLQIQTIDHVNTISIEETVTEENIATNEEHNTNYIVDQKINALGEDIENKISTGLFNIQNQMKAFCEKLIQFETRQNESLRLEEPAKRIQTLTTEKMETEENKPMIKPRTKFSKPTTLDRTVVNENEAEKLKYELNKMLSKHRHKQNLKPNYKSTSESESETDSISIVLRKEPSKIQKVQPKITKVSLKKSKGPMEKNKAPRMNMTIAEVEREKEFLKTEINDGLQMRLQEMGISPHWKGIPKKTYERALHIVRHQASQNKKYFPDYDKLKKSIENSLKHESELKTTKGKLSHVKQKQNHKEPNLIKIGYRKKNTEVSNKSEPSTRPLVIIKNRSLYDTDSAIEDELENNKPLKRIENIQKAVIEELRVVQSQTEHVKSGDTDSDLKSLSLSDEENKIETKSAMKSYPSDGSLVKKKVLFDMEQFDTIDASQVIDKGKTEKNIESSLSDFEIS
ncbi:unnamed protein product [Phaedon cochleariae]|uniref:C2H2-type domain-containing protein n=1 Tax=Phaedon cochleariae TaxID=80249 RepID=A0A9N9SL00_PHACE|nr:unnamed protein product [Phaedon cochleariae]